MDFSRRQVKLLEASFGVSVRNPLEKGKKEGVEAHNTELLTPRISYGAEAGI